MVFALKQRPRGFAYRLGPFEDDLATKEIRTQTKVPQTCLVTLRKLLSYSKLTLLPMLSAAAVRNSLCRAFLMLMIWIKIHPGDPDAYDACESVDGTKFPSFTQGQVCTLVPSTDSQAS